VLAKVKPGATDYCFTAHGRPQWVSELGFKGLSVETTAGVKAGRSGFELE